MHDVAELQTITTYNGWSNRETWVVNLWLTNEPYAYDVIVSKGFYNEQRDSLVKWAVCKCLNSLIGLTGKMGLLAAPFIIISCLPQGSSCKSDNPLST